MHQLRLVSIGILFSFTAMAAVNPPGPRQSRTCGCSGTSVLVEVTGALNAGDDCSTFALFDNTNDKAVAVGEPSTAPTTTLGSSSTTSNCSDLGTGAADDCFPTTSNYFKGQMFAHLSGNNTKDMRLPNSWQMPSATVHPGTKYTSLAFMQHGSNGSTYHACYGDSSTDTRTFCKICATP